MADTFQSLTHPREVEFATTLVQPPTAFYVSQEERIRIRSIGGTLGRTFSVVVRLLLPDGTVQVITTSYTTVTVYGYDNFYLPLTEGFVLSIQCGTTDPIAGRGELYLAVELVRGTDTKPVLVAVFCAGYLTQNYGPSWPTGGVEVPSSGNGLSLQKTIPDPGAGQQWIYTVPFGVRWRVQALTMTYSADATVASRFARLAITQGGFAMTIAVQSAVITAGQTALVIFGPTGNYATGTVPYIVSPLPQGLVLASGAVLNPAFGNIQAGDTITLTKLLVEEWKE